VWSMIWPALCVGVVCCGGLLLTAPIVGGLFSNVVRNLGTPTP